MIVRVTRPVMMGMNISRDGYEPLDPRGPTGARLATLLGPDVFGQFDRTNVLDRRIWSREAARERANEVIASMEGRHVAVFGNEAWLVLSLHKCLWLKSIDHGGATWWRTPHPSGRNLYYNDSTRRNLVVEMFDEILRRAST